MASVIGIMGESGSGKTTSARNLNPNETYYIDSDGKGLSWKSWQTQYSSVNKNYYRSSDPTVISEVIRRISIERPHIKTIIVDTVNGIMVDSEMKRMKEKGYDKWQDLAAYVYDLICLPFSLREDLIVVFMFHVQDSCDENGNHFYHILTSGRKLEKIKLETKLTNLFFAKRKNKEYIFETQSNNSTAKSYMGLFEEEIPNDLKTIINQIKNFEKGE